MSRLWPICEAAQADYEQLRTVILAGATPVGPAAARFWREGLWGLIRRPAAEAIFSANLFGARRPPWTPYDDPRLDAVSHAYLLVIDASSANPQIATGSA
jgi:hypothetical protein